MKSFWLFVPLLFTFSFINFSSGQEEVANDSDKPAARFNRVVFDDKVDLEGLRRVLDSKKDQITSEDSSVKILSLRRLPKNLTLSDITFDVEDNEIKLKDGTVLSEYKLKPNMTTKDVVNLINSDEDGLVWLKVEVSGYEYEDETGKAIPTRPASGSYKASPKKREAYFVINAKYMEVDFFLFFDSGGYEFF